MYYLGLNKLSFEISFYFLMDYKILSPWINCYVWMEGNERGVEKGGCERFNESCL
jgi:hypothetical protein